MDFGLYARVLWRFRLLVLLGLTLATSLALLSLVRVSSDGVSYRQVELWSGTTRLLVTQAGFPEGRLYGQTAAAGDESPDPVVDPARFNNLAVLYSQLATSDAVRGLMRRDGPILGQIIATTVVGGGEFKTQLPMIDLTAISTTPEGALRLAERSGNALATYISNQQRASHVPVADRAVIVPVIRPLKPQLFQPRSKTMPAVVFFVVMFVTVGLAFLLENLRPRLSQAVVSTQPDLEPAQPKRRRTA
jgi:hypothetical protein